VISNTEKDRRYWETKSNTDPKEVKPIQVMVPVSKIIKWIRGLKR